MLKRLLLGAALAVMASAATFAANIPLIGGAVDPANEIQALNQLTLNIIAGVNGNLAVLPASVATTLTTIQALMTYTAPGGALSLPGQIMHVRAWGVNSADANVKTVTFAYGAATCAQVVTGSGNTWVEDFYVVKTGAATQTTECHGQTGTTLVASVQSTGTNTDASATTVTVSGTAATAGTVTLVGAYVEQLK